jgi:hypothetical protein
MTARKHETVILTKEEMNALMEADALLKCAEEQRREDELDANDARLVAELTAIGVASKGRDGDGHNGL